MMAKPRCMLMERRYGLVLCDPEIRPVSRPEFARRPRADVSDHFEAIHFEYLKAKLMEIAARPVL